MSKRLLLAGLSILVSVACMTSQDAMESTSSAVSSCPWDPGFGIHECDQGEWWLEYSVTDTSTTAMHVEVQNTTRVIDLSSRVDLGDGTAKFTGGPDDGPVTTGTMVRVVATNGTQTATSQWFAYLQATPTVQCTTTDAGSDTSTKDSGTTDSGKVDSGKDSGTTDGGKDSGTTDSSGTDSGNTCGSTWIPFWQETEYAGSWWTEFQVFGGGSLPTKVSLEVIGDKTYTLTYGYGKWTGGVDGVPSGATAILHATDATGATAQTAPFKYLVDTAPKTDPCKGTASKSMSCLPLSRGMLSLTMDDSYPSQNTLALPLLNKYGVKATIYNITRQLDLYGDLPNAQALANAGNETGSHTVTHPDLTTLSAVDLDNELKNSQTYLLANVGTPVSSIATPMGSYNATVLTAIKKYYTSHRTVNPGLNYMGSSVWELNSDGAYNNVSPQTICAGLKEAATNHGWRILMFHDFTTASTSSADLLYPIADFESILQCAVATPGLDVVTTTQGADAIRCASP